MRIDFEVLRFSDNSDEPKTDIGLYALDEEDNQLDMMPGQIRQQYKSLSMMADGIADLIRQTYGFRMRGIGIDIYLHQNKGESALYIEPQADKSGAVSAEAKKDIGEAFKNFQRLALEDGLMDIAVVPQYFGIRTQSLEELFEFYMTLIKGGGFDISARDTSIDKGFVGNYTEDQIREAVTKDIGRLQREFEKAQKAAPKEIITAPASLDEDRDACTNAINAIGASLYKILNSDKYECVFYRGASGYGLHVVPRSLEEQGQANELLAFFLSIPQENLPEGVTCNAEDGIFRLQSAEHLIALNDMLQSTYNIMDPEELPEPVTMQPDKIWDRPVPATPQAMLCEIMHGLGKFKYNVTQEWTHDKEGALHIFGIDVDGLPEAEFTILQGMLSDINDRGGQWKDFEIDPDTLTIMMKDLSMMCNALDTFAQSLGLNFGTEQLKDERLEEEGLPYEDFERYLQNDETLAHVLSDHVFIDRKHMLRDIGKFTILVNQGGFICPYSIDDVRQKMIRPLNVEPHLTIM